MYPNLYFFLKDAFHIEPWPFTQYINSFGFFVAISFVLAAMILSSELKRKEKQGLLQPMEENRLVGEPAKWHELLFNLLFGFFVGYKIIGAFSNPEQTNPQEYIFSAKGSWAGGILLGLLFSGIKYFEKRQQALPVPEERKIRIWPHERVGDITIMAAVAGFLGAKLFDNLENWDRFIQNPIANLLSPSGLTFYGGLICAAAAILYYARKKSIAWTHLVDAAAPALMFSYATGRIGCHVAGDGDWGIFNSAYMLDGAGKIVEAPAGQFKAMLMGNPSFTQYLVGEYGNLDAIPHTYFKGLSLLPNWFWAYNYPHNVNNIGSPIAGCEGSYCAQLNPLVFPTPLYEIIACLLLFGVLWSLRRKIRIPGRIFALYLFLNGMERFAIEKIRVNSTYSIFGFHPTQAELIATLLMIGGATLWWWTGRSRTAASASQP
jgi:phosphatidylglycerol:prolipoprotein diacylglycerol transferase